MLTIVHKKTQFSHSTNISFRRTGVLGDVLLFPCRADIISSCNLIKSVYLFFFVVTKRHKFASKNIFIQFLSILSLPKGAYVPKGYFPSSPISSCRFGGLPTCQIICVPFFSFLSSQFFPNSFHSFLFALWLYSRCYTVFRIFLFINMFRYLKHGPYNQRFHDLFCCLPHY